MLKYTNKKLISVDDWDDLVEQTYKRPYNFQQQDGCQGRGIRSITIPSESDDFENDTIPEVVNGNEMGVSFKAWLERDPNQKLKNQNADYQLGLWWDRNFYPDLQTVANDLYNKGLIEEGDYVINIDW